MKYDYIDIGTSDFLTNVSVLQDSQTILLVEPLAFLLDNLPNGPNIIKENAAIGNYDGTGSMFYIPPSYIEKYDLPFWLKGCNSFNSSHNKFEEIKHLIQPSFIHRDEVPVLSVSSLVAKHKIDTVGRLTIDTEGHDHVILKQFYDLVLNKEICIEEIIIEYNAVFNNTKELDVLMEQFILLGYEKITFDYSLQAKYPTIFIDDIILKRRKICQ